MKSFLLVFYQHNEQKDQQVCLLTLFATDFFHHDFTEQSLYGTVSTKSDLYTVYFASCENEISKELKCAY